MYLIKLHIFTLFQNGRFSQYHHQDEKASIRQKRCCKSFNQLLNISGVQCIKGKKLCLPQEKTNNKNIREKNYNKNLMKMYSYR